MYNYNQNGIYTCCNEQRGIVNFKYASDAKLNHNLLRNEALKCKQLKKIALEAYNFFRNGYVNVREHAGKYNK